MSLLCLLKQADGTSKRRHGEWGWGLALNRIGPSTESIFHANGYGPQCIVVARRGGGTKAVDNVATGIRRVYLRQLMIEFWTVRRDSSQIFV